LTGEARYWPENRVLAGSRLCGQNEDMQRISGFFALWGTCSLLIACPPMDGPDDAGEGDADAGVIDAGPEIEFPPYEVEEGWYPEGGLNEQPWVCDMAPYRWWGTDALGDLLQVEQTHTLSLDLLTGLRDQLAAAIAFGREPEAAVNVYRVLYTTQDKGSLEEATALIAWPETDQATELPVLLYLHGTTGFTDDCSPSRGIENILAPNYYNVVTIGLFASWGYVVVAPDYIGLKSLGAAHGTFHPYFAAEPTAISSLDSVRAAKKLLAQEQDDIVTGDVVVMGVSQGGHASAFTVRYQPHYAPELNIVGATYAVPPLNLVEESFAALENPTPTTQGNAAVILVSHDSWYQSAPGGIEEVLQPGPAADVIDYMNNNCTLPDLTGPADAIFTEGLLNGTAQPWLCYGEANSLPFTTVEKLDNVPALVVLADNDDLVNTPVERQTVEDLCAAGYDLQFLECQNAGHTEGFTYSIDDQLDFLEARLAGDPMPAGACDITPPQVCSSDPR
jgi:dienelactone hydrolase